MLKRLNILIMTVLMAVPAMAQPKESCECVFGPKAGQWQFEVALGQGQFFNDVQGLYYLLPHEDGTALGTGINSDAIEINDGMGNANICADNATFILNTGSLNRNSLTNIASIGFKYFVTDHISLNLAGAYQLNIQPSKDYLEGEHYDVDKVNVSEYDVSDIQSKVDIRDIYPSKAVLGAVTNSLFLQIGSDYYFNVKNPRINPYLGIFGQFKMARIESYFPYTGQIIASDIYDPQLAGDLKYEEVDMYRTNRAGQILGFVGGINAGIDYVVAESVILGLQVAPVAYQYSLIHLDVAGQDSFYTMNHNLRAFAYPQLKIGFRF